MRRLRAALAALSLSFAPLSASADGGDSTNRDAGIGLALGSGGASGLSHIAMLRVFDELEVLPARISGTSIGAVIGGLYAAGLSADEIEDIFDDFGGSRLDLLSQLNDLEDIGLTDLFQLGTDNTGLLNAESFIEFLQDRVEARRFDELRIPMQMVATDFWSGESVVIGEGDLFQAMQASMAVPGLFSPVSDGDRLLIDGGTSNPLPHNLFGDEFDLVVAIDVTGSRSPDDEDELNWINMLFKTFEVMQQSLIALHRQHHEPDIYLKPDISDSQLLDFNEIDSILEQSESAAEELREKLQEYLQ